MTNSRFRIRSIVALALVLALPALAPAQVWKSTAAERTLDSMFGTSGKIRKVPIAEATAFASLPTTDPDGTIRYCNDCTGAATCAGAGAGSFAFRKAGAWSCQVGGITGLTTNTIPKATSATTIGDSRLSDNGTDVLLPSGGLSMGAAPPSTGAIRLSNNNLIVSKPTSGVDVVLIGLDTSNTIQIGGITTISGSLAAFPPVTIRNPAGGSVVGLEYRNSADAEGAFAGLTTNTDSTFQIRSLANVVQIGKTGATPVEQKIKGPDGSGTDIVGASLAVSGGKSTGTGIGGDVVVQTSPSGTTGAALNTLGDRSRVLAKYTTLTEAAATAFARVAVASGTVTGGEVVLTVEANDGTDFQARTLRFGFSAVNKAGVTTTAIDTPSESVAVSLGTLTCTITAVDATNNVDLKANCTSSLVQTVLRANAVVTAKNFGVGAISAQ